MKNWTKWLLLGLISVAFGVFALGNTLLATLAVTTLTGFLFLISGAFQIIAGFADETRANKVFSIALGGLMAFLGLSFLYNPLGGMISLTLLILLLLAASGIIRLIVAYRMKMTRYFWPMLISGALSLLLAAYIVTNFEAASASLLGILMGIELVFNGLGMIVLAFFVRTAGRHG